MTASGATNGTARRDEEVVAIRYGSVQSRRSELFYRHQTYGDPDAAMRMDFYFWVLVKPDGVTLVDTGFDPDVGSRRGREVVCSPLEALGRLGIAPEDVSRVIVTHLHYDHIGNLSAFPRARFVVPRRELEFWNDPVARCKHFADAVERTEIDYVTAAWRKGRVDCLDGSESLGDGIRAISVGGHSPGQQVVVVEADAGTLALTSDSVHFYEELERGWPFSVLVDLADVYRAYALVRELHERDGAVVVPSHDPAVLARFPAHPSAPDIAVRLA